MKKPILLVDQDGPLAEFDLHFENLCNEHGVPLTATVATQKHRYFTDHIEDSKLRSKMRRLIEQNETWFFDLPVTPGAVEGIELLAEQFEVWICTKPMEEHVNCHSPKFQWIRRHLGPAWERRLIIAPDKSMVRGDILLDDAPKPEWFPRATWQPVIFNRPYNGDGSIWSDLPHWTWGEPVEGLTTLVEQRRLRVRSTAGPSGVSHIWNRIMDEY